MAKKSKLSNKQKQLLALTISAIAILAIFIIAMYWDNIVTSIKESGNLKEAVWVEDGQEGEVPEVEEEDQEEEVIKETFEDENGLIFTKDIITYLSCNCALVEEDGWTYTVNGDVIYNICKNGGAFDGIQTAIYPIKSTSDTSLYATINDMNERLKYGQLYFPNEEIVYKSISCLLLQDEGQTSDEDEKIGYKANSTFVSINSGNVIRIGCYQKIYAVRIEDYIYIVITTGEDSQTDYVDSIANTVAESLSYAEKPDYTDFKYQKFTTHESINDDENTVNLPREATTIDFSGYKVGRLSDDINNEEYGVFYVAGLVSKLDDRSEITSYLETIIKRLHSYDIGGDFYSVLATEYYLNSSLYYYRYGDESLKSGGYYMFGETTFSSNDETYLLESKAGTTYLAGYILPYDEDYDQIFFVEYTLSDAEIANEYLKLMQIS